MSRTVTAKSKSKAKKPTVAKFPKDREAAVEANLAMRFSSDEISDRTWKCRHMSCEEDSDRGLPAIEVQWQPAHHCGIPMHDWTHSYLVCVDIPSDEAFFTIQGETLKALQQDLAGGLEDRAKHLELVARYLRDKAESHRAMAKMERKAG